MANMALKKKPMDKDSYQKEIQKYRERLECAASDPLRLKYHLQPPMGWMNDPNGLCQKDGVYHIYHQYVPFYPELCSVLWGHVTTKDFVHYEVQDPSVYPDSEWDENGAYSGSVFQEDGVMYVYYTGNVRHTDRDYDYITEGREQNTVLITSEDGFHFSEKQLLMRNEDYPSDLSLHVRDPQVFCENGKYYMIQGARDLEARGCVLLFESNNLTDWIYKLRFCTEKPFGYMWECPNYLNIEGQKFLIACPQGIRPDGLDYASENQCGWFPLQYEFDGSAEYRLGKFCQMDRGFDFYAPQVFRDESGRWILFGWMSTPDAAYDSEVTVKNGWVHALTVPRELYVNEHGRLCQRPVKELEGMRRDGQSGRFGKGSVFHAEVPACFELKISMDAPSEDFTLLLRESAVLRYRDRVLSLDLTDCGAGRKIQGVRVKEIHGIQVLSDTSSLEIFVNDGEETFTSRIYDSMEHLQVKLDTEYGSGQAELYKI